jgi:lipoic acid synthetase
MSPRDLKIPAERHPEKAHRPDNAQPRKPDWIRVKAPTSAGYKETRDIMRENKLVTVCEEAGCPNVGECWSQGHATMMIMGEICTRGCTFCNIATGRPDALDAFEPGRVADAVAKLGLNHVVITSVDRDDLPDGGAAHYAACVREIKALNPDTAVEALTPDFRGDLGAIETVVDSGLEVYAQNLETVRRLTHPVRDPRAGYEQTLDVLEHAKRHRPEVLTKTSLMLGLGETDAEILETLEELKARDVDIVTFGQYLRPTSNHLPVERFVTPEEFAEYRRIGLDMGFLEVVSGPLVRSSYRADRVFEQNNVGL